MIEVSKLTKRYVGHLAVDDVSFSVGRGEIVGFLGPNGAGKSTTIRMLTCFLTPTSGTALIDGLSIDKDSIEVRKRIGYMPENVPLYRDMRVSEYLKFRGGLKGLRGSDLAKGVAEAIDICSLVEVERKMISTLSKGYRQRVGLADALVNKPDLLILDEPTNGLDPQQIRQFRQLIKRLGQKHTIFLSTHILPEVEMTCDRVMIINRGQLKASDTPANLAQGKDRTHSTTLEWNANTDKGAAAVKKLPMISSVDKQALDSGWSRLTVTAKKGSKNQDNIGEALYDLAVARGWKIRHLSNTETGGTLEDAFVNIVRKEELNE